MQCSIYLDILDEFFTQNENIAFIQLVDGYLANSQNEERLAHVFPPQLQEEVVAGRDLTPKIVGVINFG